MQSITVELSDRSYPIHIGTSTENDMVSALKARLESWSHAIVCVDASIRKTIGDSILQRLSDAKVRTSLIEIPSGEESKSIEQIGRMWSELLAAKTDRKSVLIAIGGGVVGDLAGFGAASFNRGIRFVQVPTTLLSMVDSSVGGKTGINLPQAKNIVGAFWQPQLVWIDTDYLNSLPDREYLSGLAEVIKYGVILDEPFFAYLETNANAILKRDAQVVQYIVRRSCELKAHVVANDERETTGLRAILNYGHTFGHAIEATTSYGTYLHGEAIAIGMTMAGQLALQQGLWSEDCLVRQTRLIERLGLPTKAVGLEPQQLLDAMQLDKKTEHGKLNFILPTCIGHVKTVSGVNADSVVEAITHS